MTDSKLYGMRRKDGTIRQTVDSLVGGPRYMKWTAEGEECIEVEIAPKGTMMRLDSILRTVDSQTALARFIDETNRHAHALLAERESCETEGARKSVSDVRIF